MPTQSDAICFSYRIVYLMADLDELLTNINTSYSMAIDVFREVQV